MNSLSLFNTLARKKEVISRKKQGSNKKPKVSLYTCGPTVYNYAHIGNLRTYIFEDLLKRTLLFLDYDVQHVMNITDVDDKTIQEAVKNNVSLDDFCDRYTQAFQEDLASLRILPANVYPKATEHISDMIVMIEELIRKKHAYKSRDGSIYFSIASYKEYGKLSQFSLSSLQEGASKRTHCDEYDKENVSDFVLWKAYDPQRDGPIYWESPFGKGRPGWHIECSSMCLHHLGETIDIHCGGVDNIFPHHENEIAQSECYTGKPFVHLWAHAAHLVVDGKKMSKSKNNFYTLRDLLDKGYAAREIRYLLLHVHYRSPLNFTFASLRSAKAALDRIYDCIDRLKSVTLQIPCDFSPEEYLTDFQQALCDDLNISCALSALFSLIREANLLLEKNRLSVEKAESTLQVIRSMDTVLDVCFVSKETVPDAIIKALEQRQKARLAKNWKEADRLRDWIESTGYVIEDTPAGARVKKESV